LKRYNKKSSLKYFRLDFLLSGLAVKN